MRLCTCADLTLMQHAAQLQFEDGRGPRPLALAMVTAVVSTTAQHHIVRLPRAPVAARLGSGGTLGPGPDAAPAHRRHRASSGCRRSNTARRPPSWSSATVGACRDDDTRRAAATNRGRRSTLKAGRCNASYICSVAAQTWR
jgi:hypothetical protein